jgi:hypothetical protein
MRPILPLSGGLGGLIACNIKTLGINSLFQEVTGISAPKQGIRSTDMGAPWGSVRGSCHIRPSLTICQEFFHTAAGLRRRFQSWARKLRRAAPAGYLLSGGGAVTLPEVEAGVGAWIAHAANADTWRLRQAVFGCGWFIDEIADDIKGMIERLRGKPTSPRPAGRATPSRRANRTYEFTANSLNADEVDFVSPGHGTISAKVERLLSPPSSTARCMCRVTVN